MNLEAEHFIDTGNDWNKDKHCDIEGYFVSKEGTHKAIHYKYDDVKEKYNKHRYTNDHIYKTLIPSTDTTLLDLLPLTRYCADDEKDILSSPSINQYLRYSEKRDDYIMNKQIKKLDNIIKYFTLTKPLVVYRGELLNNKPWAEKIKNLKVGDIFKRNEYVSTSFDIPSCATYIFNKGEKVKYCAFYEIELKAGTNAVHITKEIRNMPNSKTNKEKIDEHEILLGKGNIFRVKSKHIDEIDGIKMIIYGVELI